MNVEVVAVEATLERNLRLLQGFAERVLPEHLPLWPRTHRDRRRCRNRGGRRRADDFGKVKPPVMPLKWTKSRPDSRARSVNHSDTLARRRTGFTRRPALGARGRQQRNGQRPFIGSPQQSGDHGADTNSDPSIGDFAILIIESFLILELSMTTIQTARTNQKSLHSTTNQ